MSLPTVPELLAANLHEVFGNRDLPSRLAAIERIYTEDVSFDDQEGAVVGRRAVADKVAALLAEVPEDFVFVEDSRLYAAADTGALAWAFGPQGDPRVRGIDVITVRDGMITGVRTFFAA